MKKLTWLMGASVALIATGCSSDEVNQVNPGNEITFTTSAEKNSRAAELFCNNNKPNDFDVWAIYTDAQGTVNPVPYFAGETYTLNNGFWTNSGTPRYWPQTGKLDFLALKNHDNKLNGNLVGLALNNYEVKTDVAQQEDLMYAIERQVSRPANGQVTLNFRHALSQIVFNMKNTNPNIYIEVYGVELAKVQGKGTYTFATSGNTTDNINDHTGAGQYFTTGRGNWTFPNGQMPVKYRVNFSNAIAAAYNATDVVNLTDPAGNTQIDPNPLTGSNMAMLLLPQTTTAWNTTYNPLAQRNGNGEYADNGSYIVLYCKIWNVANPTLGKQASDVLIFDGTTANHGAYIPLAFSWQEGKKYIYTIIFDKDGNGGIDPDDPNNPTPVLNQVKIVTTVDDFVLGGTQEVKADVNCPLVLTGINPAWESVHGMDLD